MKYILQSILFTSSISKVAVSGQQSGGGSGTSKKNPPLHKQMTSYAGFRDYVGSLKSPWRTLHWSPHPTEKEDPDSLVENSDPLVASSVRVFWARNSQREGRSLPREGRGPLFQWDVGISVGFSTGTTGSLRNPETRRTPSNVCNITKITSTIYDFANKHYKLWMFKDLSNSSEWGGYGRRPIL